MIYLGDEIVAMLGKVNNKFKQIHMTYQAILFDLDNTILNFQRASLDALQAVHQNWFAELMEFSRFSEIYHVINHGMWQAVERGELSPAHLSILRFEALLGELSFEEDANKIKEQYEYHLARAVHWYPETEQALDYLGQHFKLAIITNGLEQVQLIKFKHAHLERWFEFMLISEQEGISKPDPEIFRRALMRLDLQPDACLMVGDSLSSDYQGAMNADIDFCWFNPDQRELPAEYAKPRFEVANLLELTEKLS